jgi:drug/metabolite transporter (DMT)-like permease
MVQLSVPVIVALAAVMLLSEQISVRLVTSAALIVGGIALAVAPRSR